MIGSPGEGGKKKKKKSQIWLKHETMIPAQTGQSIIIIPAKNKAAISSWTRRLSILMDERNRRTHTYTPTRAAIYDEAKRAHALMSRRGLTSSESRALYLRLIRKFEKNTGSRYY